jgi:steroid delta-isomerase-like uncharacterized protein
MTTTDLRERREATIQHHHSDETVVVEGMMSGTHRNDWAGIPAQGNQMQVPAVCIFDIDEDRLVNESVYFDFATLQRQLL